MAVFPSRQEALLMPFIVRQTENLVNFNIRFPLCRNNDAVGYTRGAQRGLGFALGRAEGLSLPTLPLHQTALAGQNGPCLLLDVAG